MTGMSGSVGLSGVTDKEMLTIWEHKTKHGTKLQFNPQQFQAAYGPQGATYNNVQFTYSDIHSLNVLTELLNDLHKTGEQVKAAGQ